MKMIVLATNKTTEEIVG